MTTPVLAGPDWEEVRLDIEPAMKPDIVASMTDMGAVASASMDAIFAHHVLEHLYPHEVPVALAEFARVLNPGGFVIIGCPDLQKVGELMAAGKLLEPAYVSNSGPISPLDMLYGFGPALRLGQMPMAHHCGFTQQSLSQHLLEAGFAQTMAHKFGFNLTVYGRRQALPDEAALAWARSHIVITAL